MIENADVNVNRIKRKGEKKGRDKTIKLSPPSIHYFFKLTYYNV